MAPAGGDAEQPSTIFQQATAPASPLAEPKTEAPPESIAVGRPAAHVSPEGQPSRPSGPYANPQTATDAQPLSAPGIEATVNLIETARAAIESAGKNGSLSWTQSFQKRETAKRIAETMKRKQAEHAACAATGTSAPDTTKAEAPPPPKRPLDHRNPRSALAPVDVGQ